MKKLTKSDFVKVSISVHGDKYDYSESDYKNNLSMLNILCNVHGTFVQRASNHMRGMGCYHCRKMKPKDPNFISRAIQVHGDKYDYSKVEYDGSFPHVTIICKKHGEFRQSPANHLSGRMCDKCAREATRIGEEKIESMFRSVHGDKYDYSLTEFSNIRAKITILCKEHGEFKQRTRNHINGQGCPKCGDRFGIKENLWLDSLNIKERQIRIGRYVVDGYCSKTKTIYEFNGDFWHGNPDVYNQEELNIVNNTKFGDLYKKTRNREKYLSDLGFNIVSIWENDFNLSHIHRK
jgi:very-short-patch-repair endonuclease